MLQGRASRGFSKRGERIRERFPAPREHRLHERPEQREVPNGRIGRVKAQLDERRVDLRRRSEGARRQREKPRSPGRNARSAP